MNRNKERIPEKEIVTENQERGETPLEFLIKFGDYKKVSESEQFWELSEGVREDVMQETVANRIKREEQKFYRIVAKSPLLGERKLKEIKELRKLHSALDISSVWQEDEKAEKPHKKAA